MKKSRVRHKAQPSSPSPDSASALANGIADDFNNILTTVMGACSLIDQEVAANSELLQYVNLIRTSAERAASLSVRLANSDDTTAKTTKKSRRVASSSSLAVSTRDKTTDDAIVSTCNPSGGTPS